MRKHGKVVKTGFSVLDEKLQGLQGSDLIILAGHRSVGKTALALSIVRNVTLREDRAPVVAIFSLKVNRNALMARLIASEAGVNLNDVRRGFIRREQWTNLTNAAERFTAAPLYIDDSSVVTVAAIRSRTRRLAGELRASRKRLGLLIIDSLQLIADPRPLKPGAPVKGVAEGAEIIRQLKSLASALDIPVIVLSSICGKIEGRRLQRPTIADFNPAIAQHADIVACIFRGGLRPPAVEGAAEKAHVIVVKNLRGKTGSVALRYSRENSSFLPAA